MDVIIDKRKRKRNESENEDGDTSIEKNGTKNLKIENGEKQEDYAFIDENKDYTNNI